MCLILVADFLVMIISFFNNWLLWSIIKSKHFPKNVEIIAEPGRFLVASCKTIVTRVISTRTQSDYMNYFINEGIYGALNYIHYDDPSCRPEVLIQFERNDKIVSTVRTTVKRKFCFS